MKSATQSANTTPIGGHGANRSGGPGVTKGIGRTPIKIETKQVGGTYVAVPEKKRTLQPKSATNTTQGFGALMGLVGKPIIATLFGVALTGCASLTPSPKASQEPVSVSQSPSSDSTQPITPEGVETGPAVREFTLANGIPLVAIEDPSQRPAVSVMVCFTNGSSIEGPGEAGAAHALEHMKFRGTKKYPEPLAELAKRGAAMNGFTYDDGVCYFENFKSGEGHEHWALEFEHDRAVNTDFDHEGFIKEKTAFLNELQTSYSDPDFLLDQALRSTAFGVHGYGHSAIGTKQDVTNLEMATIQELDKRMYQDPRQIFITVTGDFDKEAVYQSANKTFGMIPKRSDRILKPSREEPQRGTRSVVVEGPDKIARAGVAYHGLAAADVNALAQAALSYILSQPNGPLHDALVKSDIASSFQLSAYLMKDPGLFSVFAQMNEGVDPKKAQAAIAKVMEGIASGEVPLDAKTLERWKDIYRRSHAGALAKRDIDTATDLSIEQINTGDYRNFFSRPKALEEVSPDDIREFAAAYLLPTNRTDAAYIPNESVKLAPDSADAEMIEVHEAPAHADLSSITPMPKTGKAVEEATTRLMLSNGIKVAVLPSTTEGNFTYGSMRFRAAPGELTGRQAAVVVLNAILNGQRPNFDERMNALGATGSVSALTGGSMATSFSTQGKNATQAFELLAETADTLTFTDEQFQRAVKEVRAAFERAPSTSGLVSEALRSKVSGKSAGDWTKMPTIEVLLEQLDNITSSDVKELLQILRSGSTQIAVTGMVDPAQMKKQLEASFGDRTNVAHAERPPRTFTETTASYEEFDAPGKPSASVGLALEIPISYDHPDFAAMVVLKEALGAFDGPLYRAMRHSGETDTYSVKVGFDYDRISNSSNMRLTASSSTAKMDKAIRTLRKTVNTELGKPGDGGKELERLTTLGKKAADTRRFGFSWWTIIASALTDKYPVSDIDELQDRISQVTPEDVQRVHNKYLRNKLFASALAGELGKRPEKERPGS